MGCDITILCGYINSARDNNPDLPSIDTIRTAIKVSWSTCCVSYDDIVGHFTNNRRVLSTHSWEFTEMWLVHCVSLSLFVLSLHSNLAHFLLIIVPIVFWSLLHSFVLKEYFEGSNFMILWNNFFGYKFCKCIIILTSQKFLYIIIHDNNP